MCSMMWWEVGGRFRREGTYIYLWVIHVDTLQKPTQYCKAIILQLKINLKKLCVKAFSSEAKKGNALQVLP